MPDTLKDKVARLKDSYIEYYTTTPIQRYAAMFIGRDEDTVIRWRREDTDFAERVQMAHATWIQQRVAKVKPEFALERLEKLIFSPNTVVEMQSQVSLVPIDPNTPSAKELTQKSLDILMELTKRKASA